MCADGALSDQAERTLPLIESKATTSSGRKEAMAQAADTEYAGWPLIEIFGVGPDGRTCHCQLGATCKSAGKHPRRAEWQHADRVDVASMRLGANLGVRTGAPAGFWVLDIDDRGLDAMAELRKEHGLLPNTRVHRTGGGTFHYFFEMPDFDVTNRQGALPKGIDVRGTGGQVVLPPSRSAKGDYTVVRSAPILPAPAWLLDLIRPVEPSSPEVKAEASPHPYDDSYLVDRSMVDSFLKAAEPGEEAHEQTPREKKYERAIVEGEIGRLEAMKAAAVPGGDGYAGEPWDWTTFMASCQLVELANAPWSALTVEEARVIVEENAPTDAGFTAADVSAKFDSAIRKVGDKARPAPVDNSSWMDDIPAEHPVAKAAEVRQERAKADQPPADDFFGKEGLRAVMLGKAVMDEGPIRWGQNQRWWTYADSGVWTENKNAVSHRVIDLLGDRYRGAHATNAEEIVRRYAEELPIDEPNSHVMNFRNGMLEWRTGELLAHSEQYLSTVQFPHDYTPGKACPRFEAFLESVMSPDYQHLVWEMIAYLLYSGNPLQVAFLLHGPGGDGKGTLIKVITSMLGKENLAHQSLDALNTDKFAAANLFGKIANIAGDIDGTFQESTARFKMLTGEDRFSGEYKFGDSFGFNNWAVPVFSANKIPGSADVSKGYLRRWINIEFDRKFTGEPIPGLGEKLATAEMPGIIAKAMTYLRPLLERGSFLVAGEAMKGQEEFAKHLDQVRQWSEEEAMPDPDGKVKQDELYRDYRFWAERNGVGKLKSADFYTRLEGAGFARTKSKGVRYFQGIRLMQTQGPEYRGAEKATNWLDEMNA